MILRLALSLCLACSFVGAAEREHFDVLANTPGATIGDATQQAFMNAISNVARRQDSRKWGAKGNYDFARNLLAMRLPPQAPAVCSIPLAEVQVPNDTEFVIGKVAPRHGAKSMPEAQMPAPPCRSHSARSH